MKLFRFGLNIWITFASLLSFLLGWVVLAHSPKPVQNVPTTSLSAPAVLPTLVPLQALRSGGGTVDPLQDFQVQIPSNSFNGAPGPVFRSGGS